MYKLSPCCSMSIMKYKQPWNTLWYSKLLIWSRRQTRFTKCRKNLQGQRHQQRMHQSHHSLSDKSSIVSLGENGWLAMGERMKKYLHKKKHQIGCSLILEINMKWQINPTDSTVNYLLEWNWYFSTSICILKQMKHAKESWYPMI